MLAKGALTFPVVFVWFVVNSHYQRFHFSKNCSGCGSCLCAEVCLQLCSCYCKL